MLLTVIFLSTIWESGVVSIWPPESYYFSSAVPVRFFWFLFTYFIFLKLVSPSLQWMCLRGRVSMACIQKHGKILQAFNSDNYTCILEGWNSCEKNRKFSSAVLPHLRNHSFSFWGGKLVLKIRCSLVASLTWVVEYFLRSGRELDKIQREIQQYYRDLRHEFLILHPKLHL